MITLVINPDKTLTLTLSVDTQAQFDALIASHDEAFIEAHFNSAFTVVAKRAGVRDKDDLKRQYDKASKADQQAVDTILGRGTP